MKRKFKITATVDAIMELDQQVFDAVDDDFKKHLYRLESLDDILQHLAHNLIRNGLSLSSMDGWADQPNENARITSQDWEYEIFEAENG